MRPPTTPPTAPAHVLCGDRTGVSLGPPIRVPAGMAHVSPTQVTTSGSSTSATEPRGGACACGPSPSGPVEGGRGGGNHAPKQQHGRRDRKGGTRDGDADQEVAGLRGGAVCLRNRRSRRW